VMWIGGVVVPSGMRGTVGVKSDGEMFLLAKRTRRTLHTLALSGFESLACIA
jgi:hypothetical protein